MLHRTVPRTAKLTQPKTSVELRWRNLAIMTVFLTFLSPHRTSVHSHLMTVSPPKNDGAEHSINAIKQPCPSWPSPSLISLQIISPQIFPRLRCLDLNFLFPASFSFSAAIVQWTSSHWEGISGLGNMQLLSLHRCTVRALTRAK